MKTITYQGIKGCFSYLTALRKFGENNVFQGVSSFKEVFDLVATGQADYGVIPIENSLIGSIYENYDLLKQDDMQIIAEDFTKIEHCLLCIPTDLKDKGKQLQAIKKVLSHPKALEQCDDFLKKHPWIEPVVFMDTAAAAAEIAERNNPSIAAIASADAAEIYGLEILQQGIEDNPKNTTRFVTIAKMGDVSDQGDKCSLIMTLPHLPGALVEGLALFAKQNINLTKLESRPLREHPFEYLFYADFEFKSEDQARIENLLSDLRSKVQELKILGFYKRGIR